MIPAMALSALSAIWRSPALRWLALIALAAAAVWLWTGHMKREAAAAARAAIVAEYEAATAAETERRRSVLDAARAAADQAAARLAEKERQHAALLARIDELSHANDNRPCLDADSVDRLRAVGADR